MASYKVHIVDTDGSALKTITVNKPNLAATKTQFQTAGEALATAYGGTYSGTDLSSDTVVHVAGQN